MGSNTQFIAGPATTGDQNVAIGWHSQQNFTSGQGNTSVGTSALQNPVDGLFNTAIGFESLLSEKGRSAVGVGYHALMSVTTASLNTAIGSEAMLNTTTGGGLTAVGYDALMMNTTADNNTAVGNSALLNNLTGINNTALGPFVMRNNTTGNDNTAVGGKTLDLNLTGSFNTAFGEGALQSNVSGDHNTAMGPQALNSNLGSYNTAVGFNAGYGPGGVNANVSGSNNTFIGANSGVVSPGKSFTNATAIGYGAIVAADNTIVLGNATSMVGFGVSSPSHQLEISGTAANATGGTWLPPSDARLKDVRGPYIRGLQELIQLEPIYFHYKKDNALKLPSEPEYVGVVAQSARAVIPESTKVDAKGFLILKLDPIFWTMINAVKQLNHGWFDESQDLHLQLTSANDRGREMVMSNNLLESQNERIKNYICQKNPSSRACLH